MSDALLIRALSVSDIQSILPIERQCFPLPWSLAMFTLEMSKPSSVCICAVRDERIVGYVICSRLDNAWHLMNISVDPPERRQGIAARLILETFERADPICPNYTLEVRASNVAAIKMYEGIGFRAAGVRPGYYADNREDALIMWRSLNPGFQPPNAAFAPAEGHR